MTQRTQTLISEKSVQAKILSNATTAKSYTLNNAFSGEALSVAKLKSILETHVKAQFYDNADGTYEIYVHKTLWFIVTADLEEEDELSDEDIAESQLQKRIQNRENMEGWNDR